MLLILSLIYQLVIQHATYMDRSNVKLPRSAWISDIWTGFDYQKYKKCEKIPAKKVLKWLK